MNCTFEAQLTRARNGDAGPDPDIAGRGVIIAFLLTGFVTVLAIVFAYFTQALEGKLMSAADHRIINRMRTINNKSRNDKFDYRIKAMRGLLASLSDQHMVLALAMLTAVFARWSTITSWSALTVSNLVYVSAYVHIGTISALQTHFREHQLLKLFRGFFMAVTLVLWIIVSVPVLLWSTIDSYAPSFFACNIRSYSWGGFDDAGLSILTRSVMISLLLTNYIVALRTLFSDKDLTGGASDRWAQRQLESYESGVELEEREMVRGQIKSNAGCVSSRFQKRWRAFCYMENYAFNAVSRSFMGSEICNLLASTVYGSVVLILDRSEYVSGLTDPEKVDLDEMGFGQVVPLVLLLLPFFSALQGIFDYKDDVNGIINVHVGADTSPTTSNASAATSLIGDTMATHNENCLTQQVPEHELEHANQIETETETEPGPDGHESSPEIQNVDISTQTPSTDDGDLDEHGIPRHDTINTVIADDRSRTRGAVPWQPRSWGFWLSDEDLSGQRDISALTVLWTLLQIIVSVLFGFISALPNLGWTAYLVIVIFQVGMWLRRVAHNINLVLHARKRKNLKPT